MDESDLDYYLAKPILFAPYVQNNITKYILMMERNVPLDVLETENHLGYCHGCGAAVDGAIFAQVGHNWSLVAREYAIGTIGSFGSARIISDRGSGELVKIGPEKYGFLLYTSYQGYFGVQRGIVLITDIGDRLEIVFSEPDTSFEPDIDYFESNGYDVPQYSSNTVFYVGNNANCYDLRVTTKGKKLSDSGDAVYFERIKEYFFSEGKYLPYDE